MFDSSIYGDEKSHDNKLATDYRPWDAGNMVQSPPKGLRIREANEYLDSQSAQIPGEGVPGGSTIVFLQAWR